MAPQFAMTTLAAFVARLPRVLDFEDGPTIVAGHCCDGDLHEFGGLNVKRLARDAAETAVAASVHRRPHHVARATAT